MSNIIIGTAGHIDHGKTSLIKALNGFEGDETKEEKQRGITIDLSFSNLRKAQQNIAFIDVPGHEKLVKNMIAGAFSFDCVMLVIAANEGIMPQTIEHIEIIDLLDIKELIVVITKKDLVNEEKLKEIQTQIENFLEDFNFDIKFICSVSTNDKISIENLKDQLFTIKNTNKEQENFFRYYIDRVFSVKGIGTVVTGTVLGNKCEINEKVFIPRLNKETKIKNIQVHNKNALEANISNRAALNLQNIKTTDLKRGDLISKKGYLRGFNTLDISFKCLKGKKLYHNRTYSLFIGSKKVEVKVLLFDSTTSLETGFATIKAKDEFFSIYKEKVILRQSNDTIAGGVVLNCVNDPMKKTQKKELLDALYQSNFDDAYKILLQAHKKGLGLISSAQRFALSHNEAIEFGQNLTNVFCDEKELIIYPIETKDYIKKKIEEIYTKNKFALLSNAAIKLRIKWASSSFIQIVLDELEKEEFLKREKNLYKNANIEEDFTQSLENLICKRLEEESFSPTAPYNIYDDLDIDRKLGDNILKSLCAKKQVFRLQHNLFIHANNLTLIVKEMKKIITEDGYIDIQNFKNRFELSRKYIIAYLDYLDNFSQIKKIDKKRVFVTQLV
ncbi:selenocysteine-specific translation elongation factor [Malaciobacter molluscorum LMG 25693]|uniref:Selenocysteine-specific elongation factor n=1 Tax=Malaciobacter molluscorum LMG 25693 TaxID=870501 RepID=A0A2G1DIW8_9BACT|nr:selenocysteine-specific translation elongation factor [Malaciobacter molluscorum]AXX91949.1 selenocysteine-specific elongation factor [Malaciobacter molluscorum LMG 25693]PHO18354.1 selenocysteine-specific translation elongation factor [Malaciobacter molluscorum LMG 25693]